MNTARPSRKKNTIVNVIFSYANVAYAIVSGLILVPLYLHFISFDLYGAWLASGNVLNWILVVDPGLSTVIMQRVAHSYGADDYTGIGSYATCGLFLTACIALALLVLGLSLYSFVPGWVNFANTDLVPTLEINFLLALFAAAITLFAFAVGVVNLGLQLSVAQGLVYTLSNLSTLVVTVALLYFGFGLYAITLGLLCRALMFALGGMFVMFSHFRKIKISLHFDRTKLREMLGLLSFTSLGRIGGLLSKNMDAFLIARFLGPEQVPVFVLSRRGMDVAVTLLGRTGNAIGPSLSHLSGEANPEKTRSILIRLLRINLWVLGMAFGGFLALNEGFVGLWVGADLFAGQVVSTLFCFFMIFTLMFTLLQTLCVALGDIKHNAVVQFVQAVIVFAGLLIGTYFYGLVGAALAPVLGYLMVSLWYYPSSIIKHGNLHRRDVVNLGLEAVLCLVLGLLLALFFSGVVIDAWIDLILWGTAFSSVYGLFLMAMRPILRSEMRTAKNFILHKLLGKRGMAAQ